MSRIAGLIADAAKLQRGEALPERTSLFKRAAILGSYLTLWLAHLGTEKAWWGFPIIPTTGRHFRGGSLRLV